MFLGARVTRAEDLDENEKKMSIFVWSRFGRKYQLDILDFFRASENIVYFGDGSPAEMSPKSYFWKTHPPHPENFLDRWGVWCCEGSGVSPSEENIGSLSDFPSFRDEAQLDRCSQKWSKIEIFLEEEISWPKGKWKSLVFLRFTIFENIEKWSYSFLFARGERSELESAELFPGRSFRARLGSKGTKRAIDSKSRMGKWWNIYANIYSVFEKWFWKEVSTKNQIFEMKEKGFWVLR